MNTTTTPKNTTAPKWSETLAKFKSAWVSKCKKESKISRDEVLNVLISLSCTLEDVRSIKSSLNTKSFYLMLSDATTEQLVFLCDSERKFSKKEFLEIVENFIFEHDSDRGLVYPHDSEEIEKIVKCFFDNTTRIDCTWKDFENYVLTPLLFCS